MTCKKCNKINEKNAVYCTKCGEKLEKNIKTTEAGLRKSIKRDAKLKNKAYFVILTLMVLALILFFNFFFSELFSMAPTNKEGENILLKYVKVFSQIFFSSILIYGIIKGSLDLSRNKQTNLSIILNDCIEKFENILVIFSIQAILFAIIEIITNINSRYSIGFIVTLALVIIFIYYLPVIEMAICMQADDKHKKLSFTKILKNANEMTEGHRAEYYALMLSFIPIFILGIFTLGILYLWLIPYLYISKTNLYMHWSKEKDFSSDEEGLSTSTIFLLVIVTLIVLSFIILTVVSICETIDNSNYNMPPNIPYIYE